MKTTEEKIDELIAQLESSELVKSIVNDLINELSKKTLPDYIIEQRDPNRLHILKLSQNTIEYELCLEKPGSNCFATFIPYPTRDIYSKYNRICLTNEELKAAIPDFDKVPMTAINSYNYMFNKISKLFEQNGNNN